MERSHAPIFDAIRRGHPPDRAAIGGPGCRATGTGGRLNGPGCGMGDRIAVILPDGPEAGAGRPGLVLPCTYPGEDRER